MTAFIGNTICIAAIAGLVVLSIRNLRGGCGCGDSCSCGGSCSGCSGGCSHKAEK